MYFDCWSKLWFFGIVENKVKLQIEWSREDENKVENESKVKNGSKVEIRNKKPKIESKNL